jgi:pimeloyl-ACP methyl ester carboxylesterase
MTTTTFVLVHGAGCTSAVWTPTVRELVLRGHRALAVDLPGHGFGATHVRPTDDSTLPLAVQDLMIAEGDALTPENPFDVHSLASSHVRFQLHPDEFVTILDGLAR